VRSGEFSWQRILNFEDEMDALLNQRPFEPFAMIVTSGDRYEVLDPDMVTLGQNVVTLIQGTSGMVVMRKNQMVALQRR
jgi:hypothetical protein